MTLYNILTARKGLTVNKAMKSTSALIFLIFFTTGVTSITILLFYAPPPEIYTNQSKKGPKYIFLKHVIFVIQEVTFDDYNNNKDRYLVCLTHTGPKHLEIL